MKSIMQAVLCLGISAGLVAGCAPSSSAGPRETNETRSDKGMNAYGAYQAPAAHRQVVTDLRVSQSGVTTRSAHGLAYELESIPAVKGAAVLVVGPDAFVGITTDPNHALTPSDEQLVRRKVFTLDSTIKSCRLTAEPRAVQYLSGYTDALEKGRPLTTYQEQFRSFVEQTFQNAAQ
ncbi:YhcN/YlaJ family sporulation lipoprotein [Tumebacillus sp. ITR2]|uniref:YhcN/YlaJ family sporulation lipoprotein n=1 Tax=Tumebacillus amylolyticus TaxID=2801339 RepID=A0ABS1JBJ8_9BACL|nr:YhcN/YlaJ family sporulation lipoprotein [Tumebacillus amylolyticus]MBL0387638.1 YhcN/YlaJ family sporulation lipoprotein [Tumebacillus amylolyticus]